MQALPRLKLKKGKEKPILQHHLWIYSGAVAVLPDAPLAEVESYAGERLGIALLSKGHSITGHMIAFGSETLEEALVQRIKEAVRMRRVWFDANSTNAVRLINAEGDKIPGLIVDSYAGILVLQISHPSLESLKDIIISCLQHECSPLAIYEKSTSFLRKKSGLQEARGLLSGSDHPEVEVLENGLKFLVDIQTGQKTGLFLDQREMRSCLREHAKGRRVLNGFAYTGGFSVAALAGGATHVDSVEISARCAPAIEKNMALNHFSNHRFIQADFFDFLKTSDLVYDFIILDPPAFVKKREDIGTAFRAYKELNKAVISKIPSGSLLLTCSCSYHVDETLFQNIIFRACLESDRQARIVSRHRQALDHPVSIFHPESSYLKSLLLYIS